MKGFFSLRSNKESEERYTKQLLAISSSACMDEEIWIADVGREKVAKKYALQAKVVDKIGFFISHSWEDDADDQFRSKSAAPSKAINEQKRLRMYGAKKKAEFVNQVEEHILPFNPELDKDELTFWLDKACIAHNNSAWKKAGIARLEDYIRASQGLLVLLNSRYLSRLWCIYEWACFLVYHHPKRIFVGFWTFTAPGQASFDVVLRNMRNLSMDKLGCGLEADRAVLLSKVHSYYRTEKDFVRFVRITLIALICRDLLKGIARYDPVGYKTYMLPLLDMASELELDDLRQVIAAFDAPQVYMKNGGEANYSTKYVPALTEHYETVVYPFLLEQRLVVLLPEHAEALLSL